MKSRGLIFLVLFTLLVSLPLLAQEPKEVITNETIYAAFRKTKEHEVMKELREALRGILDSFLTDDSEGIVNFSKQIKEKMKPLSESFKSHPGKEALYWRILSDMIYQSEQLQPYASQGKYSNAFYHFSALTNRCIECHQAAKNKKLN